MAKNDKKLIALVVYPGLRPLSLAGMFSTLSALEMKGYRVLVVAEKTGPAPTDTPLRYQAEATFADAPSPSWLFVLDGGEGALEAMQSPLLIDYVRRAGATAEMVGSVGTGALLLAKAGLLAGRRATTHWAYARHLEALGATYVRQRWVEDGRFLTAAGASAGVDVGLYLLDKLGGQAFSHANQLGLEYEPHPPLGKIPWEQLDLPALAAEFAPQPQTA